MKFTGCIWRGEKSTYWVGKCVELGLVTQANSAEDARASLRDGVRMMLKAYRDRGLLEQVLAENAEAGAPAKATESFTIEVAE